MSISISVITLNKGRDGHLRRLLDGLARGTPPVECIVVEMGDGAAPRGPLPFELRRIPFAGGGLPLAAARNCGRQAASGDVLIFLDVDCIPSADLVAALARHAGARDSLLCCGVSYLPRGAVTDGWNEAHLRHVGMRHPGRIFPSEGLAAAPHPGLFWSLAFAVRAATFDRLGGFDEGFEGYGAEDTDLAFRADAVGVPILFSAEGHAFHQWHQAYDPPLQHFSDIMANARRFRARHGFWPMQDWIDAFVRLGLVVALPDGDYRISRAPISAEIAAARLAPDRPF